MGEKLVIGPFNRGIRNDRPAFMIDNDSFPSLINAYQWRGRVKRKRGTTQLGRLTRFFKTQSIGNTNASVWMFNIYTVTGVVPEANATVKPGSVQIFIGPVVATGNLIASAITSPPGMAYTLDYDCEVFTNTIAGLTTGNQVTIAGATVVPDTGPNLVNGDWKNIEVITANTSFKIHQDSHSWGRWLAGGTWSKTLGTITFIDQGDGTLTSTTPGNSGIINYLTGDIELTHTAGAGVATQATFAYFPLLPVMGLRDFNFNSDQFPGTIAFDTVYSYNIAVTDPFIIYDVNFFKNPALDGINLPNYVPKTTNTPFVWNGQDYQQFWTINYQGALWATNGIQVPFREDHIGMQFDLITGISAPGGVVPEILTILVAGSPAVVGDFVFINEVQGINGINFQTGYVTAFNPGVSITVEFPNAAMNGAWTSGGIVQYLTTNKFPDKDCIRWFDGDPTIDSGINGWVNFMPPLSQDIFSIGDLPRKQYYLVGARIIQQFKDRLVFFGPVVQTSLDDPIYLQDTIVYSQNGTPYYTASFNFLLTNDINSSATAFHPILTPINQTATANAYFEDSTGFGGSKTAGLDEPILGVSINEDVLIIGFATSQSRLVYTSNDIDPFLFFAVNSELGTGSIFSTVNMDQGVISRGNRGYIITNQSSSQRIDLEIPDQVFQINLVTNGSERFTAIRDFINEWIYFTYPDNDSIFKFPNQTLLYNYRDNSWALFNESYTTYGTFRKATGKSWLNIPWTWENWDVPWEAGSSNTLQPEIIAGNQEGFVMIRDQVTDEQPSLAILGFTGSLVTVPNHTLDDGDFIFITGALGTIGPLVNNKIFQVVNPNFTADSFLLSPNIGTGTYIGGGVITRLYRPFIRTKQFPVSWADARKTRLGPQQYLFTKNDELAQVTVLIFLSQDDTDAFNQSPIVPDPTSINNGLVYSTIVYTCPESSNLGLTPAFITPARSNLGMLSVSTSATTAVNNQSQIWHRVNTSLLGDTIQIGITLSDDQMLDVNEDGSFISQFAEIELMGIILDVQPSGVLS